jgi:hypothetical protein
MSQKVIPMRIEVFKVESEDKPYEKFTYPTMGQVSDGYHTFDELYHYRMLYNAAFVNQLAYTADERGVSDKTPIPVKSWRHSDGELCFGKDNYFVVVVQLPTGQVSNHYHGEHWDLFQVDQVERAPEWDGHTPQQAAERLEKYLRGTA